MALADQIEAGFPPGTAMPADLRRLCDYFERAGDHATGYRDPQIGYHELRPANDNLLEWFRGDTTAAGQFAAFGTGPPKSVAGHKAGRYAIGDAGDGTSKAGVESGLYSSMSPGWHCSALQIASSVDSRIALTLPFFRTEMLASVMPTFSASSVTRIFRFANMTSMLMTIAMPGSVTPLSRSRL